MEEVFNKNVDIDSIIDTIKMHKDAVCPKCGEILSYQANVDLSKIFCIYCEKCRFSAKMTYKFNTKNLSKTALDNQICIASEGVTTSASVS